MAKFDQAVVSIAGEERVIYPFGDKTFLHATAEETNGSVGVLEGFVPAGGGPHWHTHTREDEVLTVIAGQFRSWCGDREFEGGPGTTAVVPRSVPHRWTNIGSSEGRIMITVVPGGFDKFFVEIAALEILDAANIGAVETAYGIINSGVAVNSSLVKA